jgi:MFS family permease
MAFWLVADSLLITLYLFAPNIMAVYLISAMRGSAQGLSMPAWAALQADLIPRGYRATLMGLFSATRNIISTPSPTIAGYLWESHEPKTPFYILASSRIIMLLILIAFVKETLDLEKDG